MNVFRKLRLNNFQTVNYLSINKLGVVLKP